MTIPKTSTESALLAEMQAKAMNEVIRRLFAMAIEISHWGSHDFDGQGALYPQMLDEEAKKQGHSVSNNYGG